MTQKILTTSKIQLTLTVRSTSKTRKVAHYWKAHGTGHIKLSVFLGRALALAPISGFFRLSLLASRDFVYPSVRLVTLWVRPHLFCVSIRSFGDLVGASPPILCVRPFVWWHCGCVPTYFLCTSIRCWTLWVHPPYHLCWTVEQFSMEDDLW